jgi:CheY-like chemotaxis protein
MNETTNPVTGEKITYNRIGGTAENPIYFNDPTPTSTTPLSQTAIPISDLQGTQPLNIPNITPPRSEAPAVIAQADQSVINYQEAQRRADELMKMQGTQAQTERTALNRLAESVFGQRSDVLQSQAQREQSLGITEQQKALQIVNDEIAQTTIALRAEQDRIRNTPMSQAQKAVELGALEDTYGRRLTDMAIRQSAAQGNISAIREESDRQTRLLLAPLDNKLQYLSTFAKDNVDALDRKEQQRLNLIIQDVQMQREDVKTLQKAKADLITEIANNGGGTNTNLVAQIQGAKTVEEAYRIAGESGFIGKEQRLTNQLQRSLMSAQIGQIGAQARAQAQEQANRSKMMSSLFATQTADGKPIDDQQRRQQLASMVAMGALTPQQAEYITANLDILTPDKIAKQETALLRGQTVLRDINSAMKDINKAGSSAANIALNRSLQGKSGLLTEVFATKSGAFQLGQDLMSIKSNVSIEQLQAMREASPTGGALGQVPVQQQEFLMSVLGGLQVTMKPERLQQNLNDLYNIYLDTMFGSPQELSNSVKSGKLDYQTANMYLQQRKETSFNEFNLPVSMSMGQNINNLVVAPNGDLVRIK